MAPNVLQPEWEHEIEAPFVLRAARVAAPAGAVRLGATIYELGPGAAASPFHVHHANEELVIVLGGRPTLRHANGTRQLIAGEVVALPAGSEGAHRVENHDAEPARVLVASTMVFPDVVEHPDSAKLLMLTGPPLEGGALHAFRRQDAVSALDGEQLAD